MFLLRTPPIRLDRVPGRAAMTMCCEFVPRYVLERIAARGPVPAADRARAAVVLDERLRAGRPGPARSHVAPGGAGPRRTVSDAGGSTTLPGRPVRTEGAGPTGDAGTDECYDGLGSTWQLLHAEFGRDSIDGGGTPLDATVHYGQDYANAFWDGERLVFGDGDGVYFNRFTASLDVIGHELAHGLTDASARLVYSGQSGALNESVSDVVGAMVTQREAGQDAADADWLIGDELFTDRVQGVALRSMLEPGTAYDDPVLGTDPQPASMADYVTTDDDNGGVHINSGIPNRAFALAATTIGGPTWQGAGAVWLSVLLGGGVRPDCDFATFADLCVAEAGRRFGAGSSPAAAVASAWSTVGVLEGIEVLDHEGWQGAGR
ncbi:MAG TPA: M4 family metallopeptidase, partial [Actinomycetales bacterium]|nr:M4 family metallopeptidase [Actinomycetales bacterium]